MENEPATSIFAQQTLIPLNKIQVYEYFLCVF